VFAQCLLTGAASSAIAVTSTILTLPLPFSSTATRQFDLGHSVRRKNIVEKPIYFAFFFRQLFVGLTQRKMCPNARLNNKRYERLVNVVNRSEFQSSSLVLCISLSSEENDGNVGCAWIGLQPAAHLIPIHLRHHDVEKYQVGLRDCFRKIQGPSAARRDPDDVRVFQSIVRNLYIGRVSSTTRIICLSELVFTSLTQKLRYSFVMRARKGLLYSQRLYPRH
jgi:hypothetical protein